MNYIQKFNIIYEGRYNKMCKHYSHNIYSKIKRQISLYPQYCKALKLGIQKSKLCNLDLGICNTVEYTGICSFNRIKL